MKQTKTKAQVDKCRGEKTPPNKNNFVSEAL